jgi:hypothetical protein
LKLPFGVRQVVQRRLPHPLHRSANSLPSPPCSIHLPPAGQFCCSDKPRACAIDPLGARDRRSEAQGGGLEERTAASSKHQNPNSKESPITKRLLNPLSIGDSLELEAWNLEFHECFITVRALA